MTENGACRVTTRVTTKAITLPLKWILKRAMKKRNEKKKKERKKKEKKKRERKREKKRGQSDSHILLLESHEQKHRESTREWRTALYLATNNQKAYCTM